MKKSEAYHLAQVAVMGAQTISPENKIEILRILFEQEKFEIFCENNKAVTQG